MLNPDPRDEKLVGPLCPEGKADEWRLYDSAGNPPAPLPRLLEYPPPAWPPRVDEPGIVGALACEDVNEEVGTSRRVSLKRPPKTALCWDTDEETPPSEACAWAIQAESEYALCCALGGKPNESLLKPRSEPKLLAKGSYCDEDGGGWSGSMADEREPLIDNDGTFAKGSYCDEQGAGSVCDEEEKDPYIDAGGALAKGSYCDEERMGSGSVLEEREALISGGMPHVSLSVESADNRSSFSSRTCSSMPASRNLSP